jgi:hypothetical protein
MPLAQEASVAGFRSEFRKPCATSNLRKFFGDPISGGRQGQKPAKLQLWDSTPTRHRAERFGSRGYVMMLPEVGGLSVMRSPSYFETARAAISITSATSLGCEM